jgi:hypothetical protein
VLITIKLAHTVIWAGFVAVIAAIWVFAVRAQFGAAAAAIGIVLIEVAVLAVNGWRCPLTAMAARYTADRTSNFDIYLPTWLALNNKSIFGTLYVLGILMTAVLWTYGPGAP